MSRVSRKSKGVGPFSTDQSLVEIDRRTRAGRMMKGVQRELFDFLGDPTPGQRLLIQAVSVKATRLALLSERLLSGKAIADGTDHHLLAWLADMRRDLQALGLERKAGGIPMTLEAHIQQHDAKDGPADDSGAGA